MKTLQAIIEEHAGKFTASEEELLVALMEREDEMADALRDWAARLGSDSALVAFALVEIGVGTPPDDTTRELLHAQFHERVEYWNARIAEQQDGS